MARKKYAFTKAERLCGKRNFESLFKAGKSVYTQGLRLVFRVVTPEEQLQLFHTSNKKEATINQPGIQVAFSVPRKNFKRAVKRNLLKRRLREAYRTLKTSLYQNLSIDNFSAQTYHLLFIYHGRNIESYSTIYEWVQQNINKMFAQITYKPKIKSIPTNLLINPFENMKAKKPSESRTTMTEIVLPNDTNLLGNLMGGQLLHLMDVAGAIAAGRHSNRVVVTAAVDFVDFKHPIRQGDIVIIEAQVSRAFNSSMEVYIQAFAENAMTGKRLHCNSAFYTFVAVDQTNKPIPVNPIEPETPEEVALFESALERREMRLHLVGKKTDMVL